MLMLKGALETLSISSPELISTDVGPVIDVQSREKIERYLSQFNKKFQLTILK